MKKINIICALCLLITYTANAQKINKDSLSLKFGNTVSGEVIGQSVETNAANALFGQLSGLYVMESTNNTNVLDNQASFNIRGISTFGNASPLVLVDGIERDIQNLTIAEIKDVRVLKDAVSSALYGVRGANGVILITTKRGLDGFKMTANYSMSFDTPFRLPKFADSYTYSNSVNEALQLDGLDLRYNDDELNYFKNGTNLELYPNVDWIDHAYRDFGVTHKGDIQFQGGSKKFKYYSALNYANTTGLLNHTDMYPQYNSQLNKVYLNLKANIDAMITPTTTLRVNLLARLVEQKRPGQSMSKIFSELYNTPSAAFPIQTGLGYWGGTNIYTNNPIADIADKGTVKANRRTLLADMTINQRLDAITPGLFAELKIAYDNMANYNDSRTRNYEYEMVVPVLDGDNSILGANRTMLGTQTELGWNSSLNNQEMYTTLLGKIGYSKTINEHNLDAFLSYEQLDQDPTGRNTARKRQSIIGELNYKFSNKYNIDGVLNYSGTSSLPTDNHFNLFPALGVGWVISNEKFFNKRNIITYFKIKSSYGLSGSDLFSHGLDRQYYGLSGGNYWYSSNNTSSSGLKEGSLSISNLQVEKSAKFDFGADVQLFHKMNLSATYFHETRSNILVDGSPVVSSVIGIGIPQLAEGKVKNQGVEFAFNISDQINKFGYSISGNFTYAKNKIINNNEGFKPYSYLYKKGNSLNQFYGLQSNGFFNSQEDIDNSTIIQSFGELRPGDVRYVDQNNDNIIDANDVIRLGYSSLPQIYYGFNVNLNYAGFSVRAQFQGVANRDIYLNTDSEFQPLKNNSNISTWYLDENVRWTPSTKESANLPRLTTENNPNNFYKSDIWKENGSFLKLRNLELAYTLSEKLTKKLNVKIYVNGSNLFSLDHLDYADPENYGISYPTIRSYTMGVKLTF